MKRSTKKSRASSKLPKLPTNRIELAAKYMAMSNMATLDVQRIKPVDMQSLERAVDAAWEIAVTGTMEGMIDTFSGREEDYYRNEAKAIDMVEPEINHWRRLVKKNDRYCIEKFQKEIPFIFN